MASESHSGHGHVATRPPQRAALQILAIGSRARTEQPFCGQTRGRTFIASLECNNLEPRQLLCDERPGITGARNLRSHTHTSPPVTPPANAFRRQPHVDCVFARRHIRLVCAGSPLRRWSSTWLLPNGASGFRHAPPGPPPPAETPAATRRRRRSRSRLPLDNDACHDVRLGLVASIS